MRVEVTLATGLDAVTVEEPLAPAVKLNPVTEPRAMVPCETDCESESAPATESVKAPALPSPPERASDPFPVNEGALKAVTVSATLLEAESVSAGSATEMDNESEPE